MRSVEGIEPLTADHALPGAAAMRNIAPPMIRPMIAGPSGTALAHPYCSPGSGPVGSRTPHVASPAEIRLTWMLVALKT